MRVYYYRKARPSIAAAADLRKAIELGNYAAVKRAVTKDRHLIHIPTGRAGDHPVHVAAHAGHERIVQLLLHRGADPNVRNANNNTPAHLGVLQCKHRVVEVLMDLGADPGAADSANKTLLDLAANMNEK